MTTPDRKFIGHLKTLELTRAKIEQLFNRGLLVRRDVERVYEGLYLDAIASLELSLEELFIQILTGRGPSRSVVARVTFRSGQVARDVMLGGERKYLDWLPYERTEKRAKAFLRSGEPFTNIGTSNKRTIEELLSIRHAIA